MNLKVSRKLKADQIKRTFNSEYKYLKIEFLSTSTKRYEQSGDIILPRSCYLSEIKEMKKDGEISIHPWQTIKEVKNLFLKDFNLTIQIYSRARHGWVETTSKEDCTLRNLNKNGREFLNAFYDDFVLL